MKVIYNYSFKMVFQLMLLMICTQFSVKSFGSAIHLSNDYLGNSINLKKTKIVKPFISPNNVLLKNNKVKNANELHRFWLTLYKGSTSVGQTLIAYASGATQGVDGDFDALYFNDSPVALTSIIDNNEYIIQGRALPFMDVDVVVLGFKTNQPGTYTIKLSIFDGLFLGNQSILLKDNLTGILHNLKTASYTFTSTSGVFNDRFEIYYKAETTTYENGVWDYGIPTIDTKAIIKSNYSSLPGSSLLAKSLTVSSGIFTLKSGSTLTVAEEIKNNGEINQFIIENEAIVLQNSSAINQGLFTVNRNSTPLFRQDYTLWSSPVMGQNLRGFSPQTLFNRFYTYNTAAINSNNTGNGDYQQEIMTSEDSNTKKFQSGKGYLIRMPNNWFVNGVDDAATYPGIFKGVLQNGVITVPLSLANTKFNLVGNPYPSPISIDAFFIANPTINQILYFWRKTNGMTGSGYHTYSSLGSSNGVDMDNIQTGQGFFVQSNTANELNFNNSMRVNTGTTTFFKSAANSSNPSHRYWLSLYKGSEIVGQTLIGYTAGATEAVDSGVDATYFNDSPLALTSLINNEEFTIQGKGLPFLNTDSVPLGFKTDLAGNYLISLSKFDGLFAENQAIFLKDKSTNTVHNLKIEPYTFTTTAGVFNQRFEIQYQSTLGSNSSNLVANNILIGVKNQQITINAGTLIIEKIEIMDITGRVIFVLKEINHSRATIENHLSSNQIVVLRITTNDNGVINHKIIM